MSSIKTFIKSKSSNHRLSMVTCYDFSFAKILNESLIDAILVGDSAAMVMHGASSTLAANIDMMEAHVKSVALGAPSKWIVADLPFPTFQSSLDILMHATDRLMKAGAHSIKLEGVRGIEHFVSHLVTMGIPVMGHLGLQPQSVHMSGGFVVQAKTTELQDKLRTDAKTLQNLGCYSLVLECIPHLLAQSITEDLTIPTIGIGAGNATDGQILVLQDLLGMTSGFKPKFLRPFLDGKGLILQAISQYHSAVQTQNYPSREESY